MTDDRMLVEQCLAGRGEAFHGLVERYERRVFGLACRYLKNRDDAMEVTQETFVRAFDKLSTFDLSRSFKTWLVSIAANLSRDILRKRGRRGEVLDGERVAREPVRVSPLAAAAESEEAERLRRAVSELGEEKRVAVELRYFQGLTIAEVAEATEASPNTVKVRLFRARKELEEKLSES